jgi:tight adherence protein B
VILILTAVFIATLAVAIGGYVVINRRTLETADIARQRLRAGGAAPVRSWSLLKDERTSDLTLLNQLLSGRAWIETLGRQLDQAGIEMRSGAFLLLVATCGIIGIMVGRMTHDAMFLLLFTLLGWGGPFLWLRWRRRRRLKLFETQLPDAVDMLVSAMRAGYSFQAATQFIGDEMPTPLGPEFARFYDEQRLGIDVRTALLGMQERVESLDLKMFVTAVLIQRETGGNLSEVLSNLADLVRARIAMRGQIQTLVAEPKISAKFLALMPVIVFVALRFFNPTFTAPLTERPSGRLMLLAAAISVAAGYFVMMRIADVDI